MRVRAEVYVDVKGRMERKPRVLTVIRVRTTTAHVLGSNFPVEQRIVILEDKKKMIHEHDLVRPLEVKNEKGKWTKRFGK